MDVAIVGVGLHPFGRFPGVTAIEMGAIAIRRALADAGVEWRDIQFAFAGSYEVDNPDAVVALLGLTGIPFTDVYNGCATAASALTLAANTIRLGDSRPRHRGRHGQAPSRCVQRRSAPVRVPVVVRRARPVRHDEVLRDEDQQVHARPRDLARDARQGRGEELPQRRAEPERVPAQAAVRGGDPRVADAELPAHAVHVLQPRRRRRGGGAVPGRARAPLHRHADLPPRHHGADPAARRVRGAQPVAPDRGDAGRDGRRVARRVRDGGDRPRRRRRDPAPGHRRRRRGDPPRRERLLRRRRAGGARGRRRARDRRPRCRSTPTAASSRTASRSARRACARCTRSCCSSAGRRATGRCPGNPKVGYTQLYGAPGTAGVSILSV